MDGDDGTVTFGQGARDRSAPDSFTEVKYVCLLPEGRLVASCRSCPSTRGDVRSTLTGLLLKSKHLCLRIKLPRLEAI